MVKHRLTTLMVTVLAAGLLLASCGQAPSTPKPSTTGGTTGTTGGTTTSGTTTGTTTGGTTTGGTTGGTQEATQAQGTQAAISATTLLDPALATDDASRRIN